MPNNTSLSVIQRDHEIIRLLSLGYTQLQICQILGCPKSTLDNRIKILKERHNANTTVQLCVNLKGIVFD